MRTRNGGPRRQLPVPHVISRGAPARALGLQYPAYVADTAHDLFVALQRQERFPSTRSAAELEAWLRQPVELGELLELGPLDRRRYDDGARLLALWVLEHLERHPQDRRLPDVLQREVPKAHPELVVLGISTPQWIWAVAAAQRVIDAHEVDD